VISFLIACLFASTAAFVLATRTEPESEMILTCFDCVEIADMIALLHKSIGLPTEILNSQLYYMNKVTNEASSQNIIQ
jgi:hypothetical protein